MPDSLLSSRHVHVGLILLGKEMPASFGLAGSSSVFGGAVIGPIDYHVRRPI